MRKKLGECLIQAGHITEEDLERALAEQKRSGGRLGVVLMRMSLATERQIATVLAFQLGFPYVDLADNPPDAAVAVLIPGQVALNCVCIAIGLEKDLLTVAMSDPLMFSLVRDLESQTGYRVRQVVATRTDILGAIQTGYSERALALSRDSSDVVPAAPPLQRIRTVPASGTTPDPELTRGLEEEFFEPPLAGLKERSDAARIVDLAGLIISSGIKSKASDIHVEAMENGVLIRHRLDGLLRDVMNLPKWVQEALIARFKIMAGMDIAETRLPQEGRLRAISEDGTPVDFRVSAFRTLFGEKLAMRVLDRRKRAPALEELGLSARALEEARQFLEQQHGMILVAGRSGSGRTTTLGSALAVVQSGRPNIVTIEDPIEYQIPGVTQTQVDDKIALTFASALRSIMRQDPDVIMIGEIRDAETATMAMQAAQTGHLVLSTLPTDDAPSCVTRLINMGIEPSSIASGLVGVIAQRLVRRLCSHCRRQDAPSAEVMRALSISETDAAAIPFYTAIGCDQCNYTGYRGRVGVYEVMTVTGTLRRAIAARVTEDQIREAAIAGGMVSLGEDGLAKSKSGITTLEELLRVFTDVREMRTLCPGCASAVGVDFAACPQCGTHLGGACPYCGRALQPGWRFCPYCARSAEVRKRTKQEPLAGL